MNFKSILIYVALAVFYSPLVCGREIGADEDVNAVSDVFKEKKFRSISIDENSAAITCGGVLTDTSKQIIYKQHTQVEDNERCVWIVAPPNATSFRFRLEADFEGRRRYELLNIATIRHIVLSRYLILSNIELYNSTDWRTFQGNTTVITFHSPSNANSTGFLFEYESQTSLGAFISPQSENSILEANSVAFKYPSTNTNYTDSELSTFAIVPPNNTRVEGNSHLLMYSKVGMEDSCNDAASVYTFDAPRNEYILQKTYCDSTDVDVTNIRDDTALLLFKSDSWKPGQGFNVGTAPAYCGD